MAVNHDLIKARASAAIQALGRSATVRAAYLFGSQVTGDTHEFSDIDIAAFIDGAERLDLPARVRLAAKAQEQTGDDIDIHFFPAKSLDNPPRASFAQFVLRHGVPILIENRPA